MIVLIENKLCLGKGFLRNLVKKNQNLTLSTWYYTLDHFGLSATTKCSIMNNGMNLRSNIGSRMS